MSKSKFLAGALLGGLAAALLTPLSGKKNRDKVKKVAQNAGLDTKKIESKVSELTKKGAGFFGSLIQKTSDKSKIKNNKK